MTQHRVRVEVKRMLFNRRSGISPGRRLALALGLALALVGGSGGVAWANNSSQLITVTIHRSGQQAQSTDSVSIGTLQAKCPLYTPTPSFDFSAPDGTSVPGGQVNASGVWSLPDVLGCLQAPIPISAITSITVIGADGQPQLSDNAQLAAPDLQLPSDFHTNSELPFVETDGTNTVYFRPWRGLGDSNANDRVTGSGLQMDVFEGPRIPVTASASPANTAPTGTTVTFTASGPTNDSGLTYTWYVSGQQFAAGASVQLPFSSAGKFDVYVQATDTAGGSGTAHVLMTVTSSTPTTPQTGTTPSPTGSPTSPGGSGGTHSGKTPSKGAAKGRGKLGNTPTSGKHHGQSKAAGQHHSSTTTKTTPTTTTPATTPPATASPGPPASAPIKGRANSVTSGNTRPQVVSGRFISNLTPVAPSVSPLVHLIPAAVATAPALRRASPPSILPGLGGALAVVLLLVLGAGRELRWRGLTLPRFGG